VSNTHFLIANYNSDPSELVELSKGCFSIVDSSDCEESRQQILEKYGTKVKFSQNYGHNLVSYLDFIIENYYDLPPLVAFMKGNLIGRHVNLEYLGDCLDRGRFAFLWDDANLKEQFDTMYRLSPGKFLENNNSWYARNAPKRFFSNINNFLDFFFEDYKVSHFLLFAPGGCYLVERERILDNPISLYRALRDFVSYDYRPAEAFMLERTFPLFLDRTYRLREYCYNYDSITRKSLDLCEDNSYKESKGLKSFFIRLRLQIAASIYPQSR